MTDLGEVLRLRVDEIPVPPGDLDLVQRRGRRIRTRRALGAAMACLALVAGVGAVAVWTTGDTRSTLRQIEPLGALELDDGLRAYADPGGEIHLGGRTFPGKRLDFLDTDAAATPYGMVFYDAGVPRLLAASGEVVELEPGAQASDAHLTAKADAQRPWIAYGARLDGEQTLVVRDLTLDRIVATREVDDDAVIEAVDDGVVLVRTGGGTMIWDTDTDDYRTFAGGDTRIADLRNGVVLYDGAAPDGPDAADYRLVRAPVDATLTHDGRYVLDWSSRLTSTDGSPPLVLEQGPQQRGALGFWAIDTDGSVLVAEATRNYPHYVVYDCEADSGSCVELGPLVTKGGDPMFIGVDM